MAEAAVDVKAVDMKGAAAMYGVSVDTIRRALHSGALRAKRNGAKYAIGVDSLADWFDGLPDA